MRGRIRRIGAWARRSRRLVLPSWIRRRWWVVLIAVAVFVAFAVGAVFSQRIAEQTAPLMERAAQIDTPKDRVAVEKDLLQYQTDNQVKIWTTIVQAVAGVVLATGAVATWRNLRVANEAQITNRFTQAIGQLGAELKDGKPNLEVRLGGIYALERIARDSPRDHWTIMEVLTAYVRQNARRTPHSLSDLADSSSPEWPRDETPKAKEFATPRTDIQAILTVLGRRTLSQEWPEPGRLLLRKANLSEAFLYWADFHLADFYGSDLSLADFRGANLSEAVLVEANLREADLSHADLRGADLSEAFLVGADFRMADLRGANLTDADLRAAYLSEAENLTTDQIKSAAARKNARLPRKIAEELDGPAIEIESGPSPPSAS